LKVRIKLSIVDTIAWNQISIVITDSDITLKGISSSVLYTENEKIITYRLQT
jgi:hypothetical protein